MLNELAYDEPVFRPPSEANSLILQVTIGCSNNRCTFCDMYASKKFRTRSFEEISRDIEIASRAWPRPPKIFLADGDALVLPASRLIEICKLLREKFGDGIRISAYASPQNLLAKKPQDLRAIRSAGISLLYYGVESGSDFVLERIQKGATGGEIMEGLQKATNAGFETSVTWILGLGGKKYSEDHARATARLLSDCHATYVSALTLMLPFGANRIRKNFSDWEEIDAVQSLKELKIFSNEYNGPKTIFRSNHASNYLPIKATLPDDKQRLDELIDRAIADPDGFLKPEWMRAL